MLIEIYVKDLALIEEMRLTLEGGMNVVTGETGAGKSLFVQSILLLQGLRANIDLIRANAREAIVEGVFDISQNKKVQTKLQALGIEGSEFIIRRHLTRDGRNRVFLNGLSFSLAELKSIASLLLEVTGQHESQRLLHGASQQELFDSFCFQGTKRLLLEKYSLQFQKYKTLLSEITAEESRLVLREREEAILKFQLEEIENAKLTDVHEEEELLQKKIFFKNRQALQELCDEAYATISGSGALLVLSQLENKIQKLLPSDDSLSEAQNFINEARIPLTELGSFFKKYESRLPQGKLSIDEIESRLFELQKLRRKYGPELSDVIARQTALNNELAAWESSDTRLKQFKKESDELARELLSAASELSIIRQKGAADLKKKVEKELKDLAMGQGEFMIRVTRPAKAGFDHLNDTGFDLVRFEMSTNAGEPLKDLSKIASGGELSRLMLAIKKVFLIQSDAFCVFDEIDAGIGGEVAHRVGDKLKEISQNGQSLVVTHLPQIAARADHHFKIEKKTQKGATQTEVTYLEGETKREEEIARMVGGSVATQKSRELAREMRQSVK